MACKEKAAEAIRIPAARAGLSRRQPGPFAEIPGIKTDVRICPRKNLFLLPGRC
jgi:hypothetical protein